jgi:hypothetical protein
MKTKKTPAPALRCEAMVRPLRPAPRTFEHFPADATCPICGTSDDGLTVLAEISGTASDGITEAKPLHLACAVVRQWDDGMGMGFTWPNQSVQPRGPNSDKPSP